MSKFSINDRVKVVSTKNKGSDYLSTIGLCGTVVNVFSPEVNPNRPVVVKLDTLNNKRSASGYFYYTDSDLEMVEGSVGTLTPGTIDYTHVAVCEFPEGCGKYGFAVYPEYSIEPGQYVVVTNKDSFTLVRVLELVTAEDYGKPISKEVVAVPDFELYEFRKQSREEERIRKERSKELRKQLDDRINKLRDMEFYTKMVAELGDRDPLLAEMLAELKSLSGNNINE